MDNYLSFEILLPSNDIRDRTCRVWGVGVAFPADEDADQGYEQTEEQTGSEVAE